MRILQKTAHIVLLDPCRDAGGLINRAPTETRPTPSRPYSNEPGLDWLWCFGCCYFLVRDALRGFDFARGIGQEEQDWRENDADGAKCCTQGKHGADVADRRSTDNLTERVHLAADRDERGTDLRVYITCEPRCIDGLADTTDNTVRQVACDGKPEAPHQRKEQDTADDQSVRDKQCPYNDALVIGIDAPPDHFSNDQAE